MAKPPLPSAIIEAMKEVKHKIVILSGKGGVGKSTVATNLAMSFAKRGRSVGLLDVDIYGPNIPKLLGLEGVYPSAEGNKIHPITGPLNVKVMSMGFLLKNTDDAVAWRGSLVEKAIKQFLGDVMWGPLDILVVDLPPGTGDEILSVLHLIPDLDGVVIVTTPQEVAVLDARRAIQLVEKMNVQVLGIIENMSKFVCPDCNHVHDLFGGGAALQTSADFSIDYLGSLSLDPKIAALSDEGKPFVIAEPKSETASCFEKLVEKLDRKIGLTAVNPMT
ncbi:MAG: Mrp/NBP35 family ATP-binding protein [Candidatus Thorarchaeota archaeon]|jgi:Mrp family chromosome partitioning ATPase